MTAVVITFILNNSSLGFGLAMQTSTIIGILATVVITVYVLTKSKRDLFVNEDGNAIDDDGIEVVAQES